MEQKVFNTAILGFGLSGSVFHLPLIIATEGLKLTHILSSQKDVLKQKYPEIFVTNDLEDILANHDIDLVINSLPNTLHYSVTKKCLEAGKHVIVEKPFVINSKEGNELIKLAEESGLLLSVYHNRRWDNGYLTLQQVLSRLGNIYLYEAYFDRYRPELNPVKWRENTTLGSGILYDLGAHLIDQALNLFEQPTALVADLGQQRSNAKATDYFHLTLWFKETRVILGSSSLITDPRPIIAAYGDKGSYVKHGLDPQENTLRSTGTTKIDNYGIEKEIFSGVLTLSKDNILIQTPIISEQGNYQYFYQQIYLALKSSSIHKLPVTALSGLKVINMIEAAIISNNTGQKIIF